jgi:DNA-binding NarL/FixJ family response regulator
MRVMSMPIRIVLADDHAVVLAGLCSLLQLEADIEVVGATSDSTQLLELLRTQQPDVVVLDWQMPGMGGQTCLERIRQAGITSRVLVLSAFSDGDTLQAVLEAEADGFALKTEPPQQVIAAIRQVYNGQLVFPQAARRWLRTRRQPSALPTDELSAREMAVLALVAQGLTNMQIAQRLSISDNTVKFHLQNIYSKLGVANRTEAVSVYYKLVATGSLGTSGWK